MNRRTLLLFVLLCVVASAAFFFATRDADEQRTAKNPPAAISPQLLEAYTKFRAAEQLADKAQRCLTYPDPPWIHWDRDVIVAFCRSRALSYVSLDAIQVALDAGDVASVQKAFESYLDENYSDPARHGILTRAYRELFWSNSEQVRVVADRWVELAPRSAFAHAARGAYLKEVAESARGENYAQETAEESFAAMRRFAAQAETELQEAAKLEPKLTPTYDSMIFVGRLTSNRALVSFALKAGLETDPTDERFYIDWMAVSEPRWGGSLQAMADVAKKAGSLAAQNPMMKLLMEKQYAYYGEIAFQNHDYDKALKYFDEGFAHGPSPPDLASAGYAAAQLGDFEKSTWYYSEAIRFYSLGAAGYLPGRAWALRKLGRPDLEAVDLRAAAAMGGQDTEGLREKGDALTGVHQYAEAEKAYLAALSLSPTDQRSLEGIAELYLWGTKQPDKAKPYVAKLEDLYPTQPRTWDLSADLAKGVDNSKETYALKLYLTVVSKDDPSEKSCIERSNKRLLELQK